MTAQHGGRRGQWLRQITAQRRHVSTTVVGPIPRRASHIFHDRDVARRRPGRYRDARLAHARGDSNQQRVARYNI